jgi:hypothetical protein
MEVMADGLADGRGDHDGDRRVDGDHQLLDHDTRAEQELGGNAGWRSFEMEQVFEEIRVEGREVLGKVKELVAEGNIRRLIIKNEEGHVLIEVPLTVGVIGVLVAPVWAAIGALAAVVNHCTIVVERNAPVA